MRVQQVTDELAQGFDLPTQAGAIIAYVKSMPPVDNQGDGSSFSPTDLADKALPERIAAE